MWAGDGKLVCDFPPPIVLTCKGNNSTTRVAVAQSNIFRCVSQHLSGAGSSPAGSVGRDLNLQKKLNYQCLTTSVAVVLVVR